MGTQYTPQQTDIPGLIIFDATLMEDERGYLQEKFHKAKLIEAGMPASFEAKQQNVTLNKKAGTTRGMHAENWNKYVSVVGGRAFSAFCDLRKGPSFGKVVTTELSPTVTAFVPSGVATSYQCLEPNTYYMYSMDNHPSPDVKYAGVNIADKALGIDWPIPLSEATISEKDRAQPMLKDVVPVEV